MMWITCIYILYVVGEYPKCHKLVHFSLFIVMEHVLSNFQVFVVGI